MQILRTLLDPNSFFNIELLLGVAFILLGVMDPFVLPIPRTNGIRVNIPLQQKKHLFRLGLGMIILAIVMMGFTNWAGLFSPIPRKAGSQMDHRSVAYVAPTQFFVSQAFAEAAGIGAALEKLTIPQRHVGIFNTEADGRIGIYIGDVHLTRASRYIVFRIPPDWSDPGRIEADDLKKRLAPGSTLSEGRVANGGTIPFDMGSHRYDARVALKWYPFGEDFAEVAMYRR